MSLDGVKTNEYLYTAQSGQGVQTAKTAYTNSVMTEAVKNTENTSTEENKNTSKLDELLEKLCAELSKYGLKPEELKNSGILYRITGMNEQQIEQVSEQELKQILECLKTAIKDTPVSSDGKIDLEQVGKTANNYYIAIKTGWSIEGFKKHNNTVKKSTLFERLKDKDIDTKGLLKNYEKIEDVPKEVLEEALFDFFNKTLLGNLKKAKNPKEKEQIYKAQLQTFGRLLINTPDEEKAIFIQAINSLVASNRIKGFKAVLMSFDTQEARTKWSDSWTVEGKKDLALKADAEGNLPSEEDVTAFNAGLAKNQSEEGRLKSHEEFQKDAKAFFEQNKEILARIAEKEANGEELTDEEKAVKHQIEQYYTPSSAGEFAGTAMNEIISEAFKKEMLETINKDAYELPNYKEVVEQVTEFVENNPEALTMPKEELVKLLDEATNGNYSIIKENPSAQLNAPQSTETAEPVETADYGFVQKEQPVDTTRLQTIKQEIVSASEETKPVFTVEKQQASTEKLTTSEVYTLKNKAFRSASGITTYLKETGESKFSFATEVFKKFGDMGSTTQDWAMNYFSNASSTVQNLFLNKITGSVSGMIAAAKEVDLSQFNLIGVSVTTQKQIDKIQAEKA